MEICVIMSTFNGERFIRQQLDSIFQSSKNHEIILYVRDDGSTDNTVNILKKYAYDNNEKIQIDENKNIGSACSFLSAMRECPIADYYAFCDQDDIWINGKLDTAILRLGISKTPTLWFSDYQVTDSKLNVLVSSGLKAPVQDSIKAIFYNNVPGCTMVFNLALMNELRKINIKEIRMHDIMTINVALLTGKVIFEKKPYVLYRQHDSNVLGYNHKKVKPIKWFIDKLGLIYHKENYSTSEYAKAILNSFSQFMTDSQKHEYELISEMNRSIFSRLKVLNKSYTKEKFGRTSISIRLKILLNII